jgi:3-oxoacyl-(acyl-carrier-protein) synthase
MKRRRVKITGIGLVTPAGIGREAFASGILESKSRVSVLPRLSKDGDAFIGAEVTGFKLGAYVPGELPNKLPRHTQFAAAAALMALKDAGVDHATFEAGNPVLVTGTSLMDGESVIKSITGVASKGPRHALLRTVQHGPVGGIPNDVARLIGVHTRTLVLSTSCCAGIDAIGVAAGMIAAGEADMALCGGTEAPLNLHPLIEMKLAGLAPGNPENPERQSRPFDLWRTTGVIGEGAAIVLLEAESSPRPAYAYVGGYAFAIDPAAEQPAAGIYDAAKIAVGNAGFSAVDVDAINAWGPGHRVIDAVEASAMNRLFGRRLPEIPVASIKGAIGNPLGAAGAIQVSCAAIGLRDGVIAPTVNWQYPDPACPLSLSSQPRFIRHRVALVNGHGLSGTNSSLVLSGA